MTIALSAALEGMLQVDSTAARLARSFAADETGGDVVSHVVNHAMDHVVDFSAEMIALMEARNSSATSMKLAQTVDEMEAAALDVLG